MRCSKCGTDNRDTAKFCDGCGAQLQPQCPSCGALSRPGARFCDGCGFKLSRRDTVPSSSSIVNAENVRFGRDDVAHHGLDGERKTVTALFADIKGSTELMEDIDPEEARRIVDPALRLMIEAVHRYDGYIVQSTGDGIFALFGAPVAHEDHPQRALYAALRMQEDLRRYSAKLVADGGMPIEARIGATTGEVVVRSIATSAGHAEYTPIGHTANLASRMQAVAPTGSIAISEATRKLVEGYFVLKQLGPTKVKGISEPVNVYEVTGLGPIRTRLQRAAGRGYTKFVGRKREMDAMKHAAELAKAGHGQVVAAMADAGVGKSRLFFEFKATSQKGWLVLDALSLSHDKATAYVPLIDLLHVYFRITPDDDARTRREKVAGKVTMLDRSLEQETLPHLFALLGIVEGEDPLAQMDAQVRRRRTQDAVKRILLRESLNQPLMVIFEDLHWIDEETQSFLNLLVEGIANAPVLLLVNYRPEYSHQWGSKTYYTQLRLDPLGTESADEMLNALLAGNSPQLAPLKRLVLERTEGNPLFMEELVQALFDEGVLIRNGAVKVTRSLSQLKIPPTVQGILASRIDRLPPEEKELLQTLAVIGTEFPVSLVRRVVQLQPVHLDGLLSGLQNGEFIYEQPAAGDVEYSFKHALTRQVADESLLSDRRKLLHERTAQAIETLYREHLEDHYAALAHHYRSSDNAAKAVEYLRLAGEQAVDRGAYSQALASVEPALRLIGRLPEGVERPRTELEVRLMEGRAITVVYGVSSSERLHAFLHVSELGEQIGDDSALLRGLINLGFVYFNRGEITRARQIASRCLALAEQKQDRFVLVRVHLLLARCAYGAGDLIQASSAYREVIEHFDRPGAGDEFLPVNYWSYLPGTYALVQQTLGHPDQALKLSEEALRRARQLKHPFSLDTTLMLSARLRAERREPEAALERAEAAMAIGLEHGFPETGSYYRAIRAWTKAELGLDEGVDELDATFASAPTYLQPMLRSLYAQLCVRVGRADQALALLDESLAGLEESGFRLNEAELYRVKGEATLVRDTSATSAAEACFRKAIEVAKSQSARWWELRATVSLARLLAKQGKRDEARAMLAEIYNWFTEGFDTADLKDAKTLLDELTLRDGPAI